ncbi:MAG TPA: 30S ribosomal protein S4 [Thermoleophilaceae bacterium]|nr:30S ribosomal protein S4 [Thermoleophilaceae bacterium]
MGRYRGPVEKLSRREGVQLFLKGERIAAGKSALERRPYPPGEHGRGRQRQSEYRLQLREKQRAKRYYGVREREFRRYFERARREAGVLGENLLRRLERRLDNVVYRLGLATTRAQARQFVTHGHVMVGGRKVDRPSYAVDPGEVITLKPGTRIEPVVRRATELSGHVPPWLTADHDNLNGRIERLPERPEIDAPVNEQLIVELYSR